MRMPETTQTAEVLKDVLRQYVDDQKWDRLVTSGERRAKEKGLTEAEGATPYPGSAR
jgi:hypothetical protein